MAKADPHNKNKKTESKRTIRTFAAASFLNDLGSDIIYPVWPLFLTTVLGANMAVLGLIDGLGDAVVSLSQAVSGYFSDRWRKRKVFVWTGYLLGAVSRIGYGLSTVWQHVIPFRILDRSGKMRSAPRDAIIADVSTQANRGRNFGFIRSMDHLGAVVGIIICILFFERLGYRNLFLLAAVPSIIGASLIFLLIKERKAEEKKIFKGFALKDLNKNFRLFLVLSAIFSLGAFSYSFLLIYAKEAGIQTGFVPVLYLVFTAVAMLFSLPFGRLADRIGRKWVMAISFIAWGMVCLSMIISMHPVSIILAFVLFGIHRGAIEPVQKAFVSELAPQAFRATGLGAYQMIVGVCALPASLVAGILWEAAGIRMPLFLSLFLTIIAIVLLAFVKENRTSETV